MITPYEIDWTVAADPAEIEQLREVAKLPYWEKLKWLAQAGRMADYMQQSREEKERAEQNAQKES